MSDINIKKIIHEELNILVDLFYYMEKLKNGILSNDEIKSLNLVVSKISENALRLSKIEKQRIEVFERFVSQINLKNTLDDFINYFDEKDKDISKMLKELSEKLMDVYSLNSTLKELLKARIEYNDILIKLFMDSENTVPVYNRNGIYNKTIEQSKTNWQG